MQTGVTNELLEVVMGLVVGLVRLALLLEGVPPALLAKVGGAPVDNSAIDASPLFVLGNAGAQIIQF